MFKSVPEAEGKALNLLRAYSDFARTAEATLTRDGVSSGQVWAVRASVENYLELARAIQAEESYPTLSQSLQDDLQALIEEGDLLVVEMLADASPEAIFAASGSAEKEQAARGMKVHPAKSKDFADRLTHKRRNQ